MPVARRSTRLAAAVPTGGGAARGELAQVLDDLEAKESLGVEDVAELYRALDREGEGDAAEAQSTET